MRRFLRRRFCLCSFVSFGITGKSGQVRRKQTQIDLLWKASTDLAPFVFNRAVQQSRDVADDQQSA